MSTIPGKHVDKLMAIPLLPLSLLPSLHVHKNLHHQRLVAIIQINCTLLNARQNAPLPRKAVLMLYEQAKMPPPLSGNVYMSTISKSEKSQVSSFAEEPSSEQPLEETKIDLGKVKKQETEDMEGQAEVTVNPAIDTTSGGDPSKPGETIRGDDMVIITNKAAIKEDKDNNSKDVATRGDQDLNDVTTEDDKTAGAGNNEQEGDKEENKCTKL